MAQDFKLIDPNSIVGECSAAINSSLLALVTDFAGEAFPTTTVWQGMRCLRTDGNSPKVYQLRELLPEHKWVLVADLSRDVTDAITAERLRTARSINDVSFDGSKDIVLDTTRSFTAWRTAVANVDLNSLVKAGTYDELVSGTNPNGPGENDLFYVNVYTNSSNITQLLVGYKNNSIWVRNRNSNAWSNWVKAAKTGDIPSKLPADGGDADTVDSKHANNEAEQIATKDKDNCLSAKSLKSSIANESAILGALAFREDANGKNSLRFCGDKKEILKFLGFDANGIVVEKFQNGLEWYRLWSDGYCEQGGVAGWFTQNSAIVGFHKKYKDTNYSVMLSTNAGHSSGDKRYGYSWGRVDNTRFSVSAWFEESSGNVFWEARGYCS